jgi:membrane protein required for beta-lactamase induction
MGLVHLPTLVFRGLLCIGAGHLRAHSAAFRSNDRDRI